MARSDTSARMPAVPPTELLDVPPVAAFHVCCHSPPAQNRYLFGPDFWLYVNSASTRGIFVKVYAHVAGIVQLPLTSRVPRAMLGWNAPMLSCAGRPPLVLYVTWASKLG